MTYHWPRMMKRQTAAQYCDLSVPAFEREVASGSLPCPVVLGNKDHWDKAALDKALDAISGIAERDWRSQSPLYRSAVNG